MSSSPSTSNTPRIIRVSGPRSNVGKTTLIERLIPRITERGLQVGTIKHTHHGFDLDHPGKDSDRHRQAGATATVLIGPESSATLIHNDPRIDLVTATSRLSPYVDVIFAEGFRSEAGFGLVLDPQRDERVTIESHCIYISILPDDLTDDEMTRVVNACVPLTAST